MISLVPAQLEYFSQDELITIIPKQSMPTLHLLSGDVGPFEVAEESQVPLWLALLLKKRDMCYIKVPSWMTQEYLEKVLEAEKAKSQPGKQKQQTPYVLPFYWQEISLQLLEVAANDIPNAQRVRSLLEMITVTRSSRMRSNLIAVAQEKSRITAINFTKEHLGAMEINTIRPLFVRTMNHIKMLDEPLVTRQAPRRNLAASASASSGSSR